jgi:hypothetical protein
LLGHCWPKSIRCNPVMRVIVAGCMAVLLWRIQYALFELPPRLRPSSDLATLQYLLNFYTTLQE